MHIEPAPQVPQERLLRRSSIAEWFGRRPRIFDVLAIVVCTVPTVFVLVLNRPPYVWLGFACVAAIGLALWWRRSHPATVLVVVAALAALNPVAWTGTSVAFFESDVTVYTLASRRRLRTAILGYLAGEAVIFAVSVVLMLLGLREQGARVLLQPGSLVALAIGIAVRASRARRLALEELIAAREERAAAAERARITAEMHDVVAHSVTVMVALAGGARSGWEKHPQRARDALEQLGEVGSQALEEMQRILRVLRDGDGSLDVDLERSGHNLPSLEELVEGFRSAGLPVVLLGGESELPGDPALRTTAYRILRESLTNTLRHSAGATYVEAVVERDGGNLVIAVTDNGRPKDSSERSGGVGLRAMRERAEAFGGALEAGPVPTGDGAPSTGWRTRAVLPLGEGDR
ncbi:sensor histidine kinase [Gulosibacter sp. 10]|uniref:sensor histidine kinase n=1 Tax=Gulosibacter sp. 10 TaxID=1255570 RepID=UPI00097F53EC|nr:histidine kinase [Gulosibacter sp. 10]SJM70764.1 two-component system sensor kinase [Gulosibacter sp. 10]